MMVGHSTGGGEVARFLGRNGTSRVSKAVLISSVPPLMLKTGANPGGQPLEVFDNFRAKQLENRAQAFIDVPTVPFFGSNRPGATPSQGTIDSWWRQGMMAGLKATYDCIKAFSETDFTEDLKNLKIALLILHGDDDQIVPIAASAYAMNKLAPKATLKVYPGGAHALPGLEADKVNRDLLEFLKS